MRGDAVPKEASTIETVLSDAILGHLSTNDEAKAQILIQGLDEHPANPQYYLGVFPTSPVLNVE